MGEEVRSAEEEDEGCRSRGRHGSRRGKTGGGEGTRDMLGLLAVGADEQARLLDQMLSASSDHVYLVDRAGRLGYANPAAARALGLDRSAVVGKTWRELGLPRDVVEPLEAIGREVFTTGRTATTEVRLTVPDGGGRVRVHPGPNHGSGRRG